MDLGGDDLYRRAEEDEPFDELQPRLDASDTFERNEAVSEEGVTVWDGANRRILYHHGLERWYRNEIVPEDTAYDPGISLAEEQETGPVMRFTYVGGDADAFKEALEGDGRFERDHGFGSPFYEGVGCTVLIQPARVDIKVDTARAGGSETFYDLAAYGFEPDEAVLEDGEGHEMLAAENPVADDR